MAAGLPVLAGSDAPVTLDEAAAFLDGLGPGRRRGAQGGGRRRRPGHARRARSGVAGRPPSSGARRRRRPSFGDGALYVEELLPHARHIEVQILGDGTGAVAHLGERDCSIQRRHQKVVEIAPAPALAPALRERVAGRRRRPRPVACATTTSAPFEFLVAADATGSPSSRPTPASRSSTPSPRRSPASTSSPPSCAWPAARRWTSLGLDPPARRRRTAGLGDPAAGQHRDRPARRHHRCPPAAPCAVYEMPSGHGVRVDGYGYAGYRTKPSYDSLLAKIIVRRQGGTFADAVAKADRALSECRIEGVDTNIGFLHQVLRAPAFAAGAITTELRRASCYGDGRPTGRRRRAAPPLRRRRRPVRDGTRRAAVAPRRARSRSARRCRDSSSPSLVGRRRRRERRAARRRDRGDEDGARGAGGRAGPRPRGARGAGRRRAGRPGAALRRPVGRRPPPARRWRDEADLDAVREDLAEVLHRHAVTLDAARPDAVARRRATGQRTARENVADLVDPGTFVEYGPLAVAAQRRRRTLEELIAKSPADGMVTGVGSVNGELFGDPTARCAVLAYDYTVFAGTQGLRNHAKTDRLIEVAEQGRLPLVLFGEGGGGRPGEDGGDYGDTFAIFAKLSGLVPMVAIVSGRCYAGNASLVGCCDVIIATRNSNIGMGGPAMIEGGGLGVYRPEEIGPDRRAGRQRRGRHRRRGRGRRGARRQAVPRATSRVACRRGRRTTSGRCGASSPRTGCASTTCGGSSTPSPTSGSVLELRRGFGHGIITALDPRRGAPARRHRQQPGPPRRRHRLRRRRQGGALHAAVRRLRPADPQPGRHARASWSGPTSR